MRYDFNFFTSTLNGYIKRNVFAHFQKMKAELQAQMEEVAEDRLRMNLEKQQLHMDEQRIMAKYVPAV